MRCHFCRSRPYFCFDSGDQVISDARKWLNILIAYLFIKSSKNFWNCTVKSSDLWRIRSYTVSQYQLYFFKCMLCAQKSSDFLNSFTGWTLMLWLLSLKPKKLWIFEIFHLYFSWIIPWNKLNSLSRP